MNAMEAAITKERITDRSCQAMPDIGNPEYVAGLCWWRDYAVHGLVHSIRKNKTPGTYGFGDHAQKPSEFRLLQMPMWYAASDKKGHVLVFANITIVSSTAGLVADKLELIALNMRDELKRGPDQSKFWLLGRPIVVWDACSRVWQNMDIPRRISNLIKE